MEFINKVIDNCERYYEKIADSLGFRRFNFWLWENRAKLYIYDGAKEYQAATGEPSWSLGSVRPNDKVINTFVDAPYFFDTILPHEMGHIIFREFVGFKNQAIPLWLDEGVATYQEKERYALARKIVKSALEKGIFMNLEGLYNFNPRQSSTEAVGVFYSEAVSIVDFLIKEYGSDRFVLFCQYLRDKKDLPKALIASYPLRSIQELEEEWIKFLKK